MRRIRTDDLLKSVASVLIRGFKLSGKSGSYIFTLPNHARSARSVDHETNEEFHFPFDIWHLSLKKIRSGNDKCQISNGKWKMENALPSRFRNPPLTVFGPHLNKE